MCTIRINGIDYMHGIPLDEAHALARLFQEETGLIIQIIETPRAHDQIFRHALANLDAALATLEGK